MRRELSVNANKKTIRYSVVHLQVLNLTADSVGIEIVKIFLLELHYWKKNSLVRRDPRRIVEDKNLEIVWYYVHDEYIFHKGSIKRIYYSWFRHSFI